VSAVAEKRKARLVVGWRHREAKVRETRLRSRASAKGAQITQSVVKKKAA